MKNVISCFLCSLIILAISCTKKENATKSEDLLIEDVLSLKNVESQRLAFSQLLTPQQQSDVWHRRINQMMKENVLNQKQKDVVLLLKANLNSDVFGNPQKRDEFLNQFVNSWQKEAMNHLGYALIYKYFVNIKNANTANDEEIPPYDNGLSGCNCNTSSSFSCIGRNECTNSYCNSSNSGCGFLWLYSCNARCQL